MPKSNSLYEAVILNAWREKGDCASIEFLREKYFEIYFQQNQHKPKYKNVKGNLRQYMYKEFINKNLYSNIYRILKKYGRKVPMTNGYWQYDPENADNNSNISIEEVYFKNMFIDIKDDIIEYFKGKVKNNVISAQWQFSYDEPESYENDMVITFYFSTSFIKIPFDIRLRKKSFKIKPVPGFLQCVFSSDEDENETKIFFRDQFYRDEHSYLTCCVLKSVEKIFI
jgi:hypothetical protein